jgi:preprotein translocase subunit SecG
MTYLLLFLLLLLAFFLIVLVLIQRGKGGGLAGAFGGLGGQSAFGTKAGDLFTRITIGVAAVWILVCIVSVKFIGASGNRLNLAPTVPASSRTAPANSEQPLPPGAAGQTADEQASSSPETPAPAQPVQPSQ